MNPSDPPRLGRFPDESVRRAPQRSDWTPEQLRALQRLDEAMGGEGLEETAAYWRRRWVEWFLRWVAPEDYRRASAAAVAHFIERHRPRSSSFWSIWRSAGT